MHQKNEVKYPWMRAQLLATLNSLSDVTYQKDVWGKPNPIAKSYDDFDAAVSFLYDDAGLNNYAADAIGSILIDESEAALIAELLTAIDKLFQEHGKNLSDKEYRETNEWAKIVEKANQMKKMVDGSRDKMK